MTTRYANGRGFEYATRDRLADDGYEVVRAAGSKGSTKIDLVAFKSRQILFVQCKRDGKLSIVERTTLLRVASLLPGVALPVLAYKPSARGGVAFAVLTGAGPQDRRVWTPDGLEGVSA
jgi:holliday junction resolvase Hjr